MILLHVTEVKSLLLRFLEQLEVSSDRRELGEQFDGEIWKSLGKVEGKC